MAYFKTLRTQSGAAGHSKQGLANRLRRVQGQIVGIEKMLNSGRYCVDVLVQLRAVFAALKSVEAAVFENHLRTCVKDALKSKSESGVDQKIDEIMGLLGKKTQARASSAGRKTEAPQKSEGQCVH